jgi:hypothetical protein
MDRKIMIALLAVAAIAGVIWWLRRPRPTRPDEIGWVVLQAFGGEWANRFGLTAGELSTAFFEGEDASLRQRIDREIGVVDLRFDGDGQRGGVATTIMVTYAGDDQNSTARMTLPWDDTPQAVRAELLRGHGSTVFRKWRAVV